MERKKITLKEIGLKNLLIMLGAGIFLILVSFDFNIFNNNTKANTDEQLDNQVLISEKTSTQKYIELCEARLKEVLVKVSGVGNVEVMITVNESKETVILKDKPYSKDVISEDDGEGGKRESTSITNNEETVLTGGNNGGDTPFVIKEIEPRIEGVIVIAQGGGDTLIINEITSAVEVLFGIPVHKIKVMKMNSGG